MKKAASSKPKALHVQNYSVKAVSENGVSIFEIDGTGFRISAVSARHIAIWLLGKYAPWAEQREEVGMKKIRKERK